MQRARLFLLVSASISAALGGWYLLWSLCLPYPIHAREPSTIFLTMLMTSGINPYSLETHPVYANPYGVAYPLVVYPFEKFFGTPAYSSSVFFHRLVTGVTLVLTTLPLYWGMRLTRIPRLLALSGTLLYFAQIASNDFAPGGNSQGELFLFLTLVIPLAWDFNWGSVLAGMVLAVLAFYSKPYFIVGALVLGAYVFLFRSKLKGAVSFLVFVLLMTASVWEVSSLFPLYFTDSFYIHYNLGKFTHSWGHLLRVLTMYFPLGVALVALLVWRFLHPLAEGERRVLTEFPQLDFLHPSKPLVTSRAPGYVLFILAAISVVYLYELGPHAGNLVTYIFELVMPFLVWQACLIAGLDYPDRKEPILFLQATVLLVTACWIAPMMIYRSTPHPGDFQHAAEVASRYQHIFAVAGMDPILSAQGKPIYENGQSEFLSYSFDHNHTRLAAAYKARFDAYREDLNEKIMTGSFDAVMMYHSATGTHVLISRDLLSQYYHKTDEIPFRMPFEPLSLEIWEPNSPSHAAVSP